MAGDKRGASSWSGRREDPQASFFFRGTHKVRNNFRSISIIYFRGLGLRIRVRVWVGVRVRVRVGVRVRVSVVLWSG